jgi:hypothetical protein
MTQPSSNTNQEPINRDRALEMLTNVFPELKQRWEMYLQTEYQNYNEERLDYVDIGEIIRHIVEKKKRNNTSGLDEFFDRVETILVHGDGYTKDLIIIGLLEGIQNECGSEVNYYTGFNEWLKPETKKAWDEVIQFWEGNKP